MNRLTAMLLPVLYPQDPLNPRRTDPHFAAEAKVARELGATILRVNHDALVAGEATEAVRLIPDGQGPMWYRGWMMPVSEYSKLDTALRQQGNWMAVSPASYRNAHELPGWYPTFADATPESAWRETHRGQVPSAEELANLARQLGQGPGLVKDFVKSRKHEWDQACFIPELSDTAALHRVVTRFVELQGEFLAGGIVLRRFEEFDTAGEARAWWIDGTPIAVGPHPDTPDVTPDPELAHITPLVAQLGCRFVTTDLARRGDGVWRVVEVGDGQVSDRPEAVAPETMLGALLGG